MFLFHITTQTNQKPILLLNHDKNVYMKTHISPVASICRSGFSIDSQQSCFIFTQIDDFHPLFVLKQFYCGHFYKMN